MARLRSLASTTLSPARKKFPRFSTRSASLGLWSNMLNGPRTCPNTFSTASTTSWYSAGTSDLPVMGATLGMMAGSFLYGDGAHRLHATRVPSPLRRSSRDAPGVAGELREFDSSSYRPRHYIKLNSAV